MNPENRSGQNPDELGSILDAEPNHLSQSEELRWARAEHVLSSEYNKGHAWMGHYTAGDSVDKIFDKGLKISHNNLASTAVILTDHKKPLEEQSDDTKKFFVRSGHRAFTDMIIIDFFVPDDDVIRRADGALIVDERQHSLLPREYIRGSWNTANGVFTANPNFEQRDMPARKLPDLNDPLLMMDKGGQLAQDKKPFEIPGAPKSNEVPNIW